MSTTTLSGRLEHVDLGPGLWVLHTDDGRRVALHGPVPDGLGGQRVRVWGRVVTDAMGFGPNADGALVPERVERA